MTTDRSSRSSLNTNRQVLCWQGWRLEVPTRWNPIKLEGTFEEGYLLLADLVRPRLAVRWSNARKAVKDPQAWARRSLLAEVGRLAAEEASAFKMPDHRWQASTLYIEPEPPGRDVWLGFSEVSGRVVEVIHHVTRRERMLAEIVLPTLVDEGDRPLRHWAALDLSCVTPSWMRLEKPLLFAGDLGLQFAGPKRQTLVIRQIAPAEVALKRMPLQHWLRKQQLTEKKNYRPLKPLRVLKKLPPPLVSPACDDIHEPPVAAEQVTAAPGQVPVESTPMPRFAEAEAAKLGYQAVTLTAVDGRRLTGFRGELPRRRRFFFKFMVQKRLATYALHDHERNRLIIVQGGGPGVDLEAAVRSVGWAAG